MNTTHNERHQETERLIREALLYYMEQEKEPSVTEIIGRAGINRSTFYRHYVDIYDLIEKTEQEIQRGLLSSLSRMKGFEAGTGSPDLLAPMIRYVGEHRHFYRTYFQTHLSQPMENGFERIWNESIRPLFTAHGVTNERHMLYYFQMERAAFMTALRQWLVDDCPESVEEMAGILWNGAAERAKKQEVNGL